jgi:hypothetical protein
LLINRSKGSWGKAKEIRGLAALTKGSTAQIYSISCSSAGNCSGDGYGENSSFPENAFVVTPSGTGIGQERAGDHQPVVRRRLGPEPDFLPVGRALHRGRLRGERLAPRYRRAATRT